LIEQWIHLHGVVLN